MEQRQLVQLTLMMLIHSTTITVIIGTFSATKSVSKGRNLNEPVICKKNLRHLPVSLNPIETY